MFAINVVLLVGSHYRSHWHLCVDVARRRSASGDIDDRRVRSDTGRACAAAAVEARVVDAAAGPAQMTTQSCMVEIKARDAVVAVDGVACTKDRNTRVLVLNDGQCTCACVCS